MESQKSLKKTVVFKKHQVIMLPTKEKEVDKNFMIYRKIKDVFGNNIYDGKLELFDIL